MFKVSFSVSVALSCALLWTRPPCSAIRCWKCELDDCLKQSTMTTCDDYDTYGCFFEYIGNKRRQGCGLGQCKNITCWTCTNSDKCNNRRRAEFELKELLQKLTNVTDLLVNGPSEPITQSTTRKGGLKCYSCYGEECSLPFEQMAYCSGPVCKEGTANGNPLRTCSMQYCDLTKCVLKSCSWNFCNNGQLGNGTAPAPKPTDDAAGPTNNATGPTNNATGPTNNAAGPTVATPAPTAPLNASSDTTPQVIITTVAPDTTEDDVTTAADDNGPVNRALKQRPKDPEEVLLNSMECFQCEKESCEVDDDKMKRCTTNNGTCYLRVENFVEYRGCGNMCSQSRQSEKMRVCVPCYERLCNTNQEVDPEKEGRMDENFDGFGETTVTGDYAKKWNYQYLAGDYTTTNASNGKLKNYITVLLVTVGTVQYIIFKI